jgi:hypothetical protein
MTAKADEDLALQVGIGKVRVVDLRTILLGGGIAGLRIDVLNVER